MLCIVEISNPNHRKVHCRDRIVRTGGSNITVPTPFIESRLEKYAYRRFGSGPPPLVFLQHFTETLDNWDPAVTDPLASDHAALLT